jgi:hypothetical protein
MRSKFIRSILFAWLLPATIIGWVFYVLPLWMVGAIKKKTSSEFLIAEFALNAASRFTWYVKAWENWAGWGGPCVIICKGLEATEASAKIRRHEFEHCFQQFRLGVFFYPYYALAWLWILAFTRRHPYLDNPLEVSARRAAGQPVNFSRESWVGEDGKRILWR